jgi:hypothetical protein
VLLLLLALLVLVVLLALLFLLVDALALVVTATPGLAVALGLAVAPGVRGFTIEDRNQHANQRQGGEEMHEAATGADRGQRPRE